MVIRHMTHLNRDLSGRLSLDLEVSVFHASPKQKVGWVTGSSGAWQERRWR